MLNTFTWSITTSSTANVEYKADTAEFGDGYSQDSATGLNPERQAWPVTVENYGPEIQEILSFIRANFLGFLWVPPLHSEPKVFKCIKWSLSNIGGDYWSLSMQFEQTYRP